MNGIGLSRPESIRFPSSGFESNHALTPDEPIFYIVVLRYL